MGFSDIVQAQIDAWLPEVPNTATGRGDIVKGAVRVGIVRMSAGILAYQFNAYGSVRADAINEKRTNDEAVQQRKAEQQKDRIVEPGLPEALSLKSRINHTYLRTRVQADLISYLIKAEP
jgi:hypothetical protein